MVQTSTKVAVEDELESASGSVMDGWWKHRRRFITYTVIGRSST